MINRDEAKKTIWQMCDTLRSTLMGNDTIFGCMKILFLKYAIDNYIGATSPEEMRYYANAQKIFAMRDIETGTDFIAPILVTLDKAYSLSGVFCTDGLLSDYGIMLFGLDKKRNKVSANEGAFKNIMGALGALNLEDDDKRSTGKALVDAYIEEETREYYRTRVSAEFASTIPLSKIGKGILDVKTDDVFCDFASGIGLSTVTITKDSLPKIVCSDINPNSVALSAMILVMYGYEQFEVLQDDSLTNGVHFNGANKIFVDPPIGIRLDSYEEGTKVESQILAINAIKNHFSENEGKAIVAVPSGTLFQANGKAVQLRRELVGLKFVETVVSLPPLWNGTPIGTNILVLSSASNNDILFVDATATKEKEDFYDGNMDSEETINYIIDVVNNRREIAGFSKLVKYGELDDVCSFVPTNYIERVRKINHRSLSDVDAELNQLYAILSIK